MCGLGLDPVENVKMGTFTVFSTDDAHKEIIHPLLRASTRSGETETDIELLRARTVDSPVEIQRLRQPWATIG